MEDQRKGYCIRINRGRLMGKEAETKAQKERIKAELLKIGIKTDDDLREAIKKLPPLSIGIMTDPIATTHRKGVGVYG